MEIICQITSKYFCAAIIAKNGIVIEAAPILKYMIGWNGFQVKNYCEKKNFKLVKL